MPATSDLKSKIKKNGCMFHGEGPICGRLGCWLNIFSGANGVFLVSDDLNARWPSNRGSKWLGSISSQ